MVDGTKNNLFEIIDQIIQKFYLELALERLFKKEKNLRSRQDLMELILSRLYFDKPDVFPPERNTSQVDENFDWPIPLFPAESFGKEKFNDIREKDFFEGRLPENSLPQYVLLNTAVKNFKERNIPAARDGIQFTLRFVDKCIKIYAIRGGIYSEINTPKFLKALLDLFLLETAYNLDNNNQTARKEMSKVLSKTAIKFYKKKKYEKAVVAAQHALTLDKDNVSASKLLDYLKKKHTECFKNLHEEEE